MYSIFKTKRILSNNEGVFQPENIVSDDIRSWVEFWKRAFSIETINVSESSSSSSLWIVFAPRQLLMLAQSTSARQSWNHVSNLVVQLLKNGLLRYKDVQEQCLSVVRQDWPQVQNSGTDKIDFFLCIGSTLLCINLFLCVGTRLLLYRSCFAGSRHA